VLRESQLVDTATGGSFDIGLDVPRWIFTRPRSPARRLMGVKVEVVIAHDGPGYRGRVETG